MGKKVEAGRNDLATTNPELSYQWHPTKNLPLAPTDVMETTTKKIWWKCNLGHDWIAVSESRSKGTGCPYCAGQKVWKGYNDLSTTNPEIAAQWHPTKNQPLKPTEVVAGTSKKIWWACEHQHEWLAKGSKRVQGQGCPV